MGGAASKKPSEESPRDIQSEQVESSVDSDADDKSRSVSRESVSDGEESVDSSLRSVSPLIKLNQPLSTPQIDPLYREVFRDCTDEFRKTFLDHDGEYQPQWKPVETSLFVIDAEKHFQQLKYSWLKPYQDYISCHVKEDRYYVDSRFKQIITLAQIQYEHLVSGVCIDAMSNRIRNASVTLPKKVELTNLLFLNLSANLLLTLDGLEKCPNLKGLVAKDNMICTLDGICACSSLKWVNVSRNKILSLPQSTNVEEKGKCALPQSLTNLDISFNPLKSLSGVERAKKLSVLECGHCSIGDISPLLRLRRLTVLHMNHNNIGDIDSIYPVIRTLDSLYDVDFRENPFLRASKTNGNRYYTYMLGNTQQLKMLDNRVVGNDEYKRFERLKSEVKVEQLSDMLRQEITKKIDSMQKLQEQVAQRHRAEAAVLQRAVDENSKIHKEQLSDCLLYIQERMQELKRTNDLNDTSLSNLTTELAEKKGIQISLPDPPKSARRPCTRSSHCSSTSSACGSAKSKSYTSTYKGSTHSVDSRSERPLDDSPRPTTGDSRGSVRSGDSRSERPLDDSPRSTTGDSRRSVRSGDTRSERPLDGSPRPTTGDSRGSVGSGDTRSERPLDDSPRPTTGDSRGSVRSGDTRSERPFDGSPRPTTGDSRGSVRSGDTRSERPLDDSPRPTTGDSRRSVRSGDTRSERPLDDSPRPTTGDNRRSVGSGDTRSERPLDDSPRPTTGDSRRIIGRGDSLSGKLP